MSDADAREVIEKALRDRHMADQNDPILGGGDALRLNAHLYAFAVLDELDQAGYQLVKLEPGQYTILEWKLGDDELRTRQGPIDPNKRDALALRPWEV